MLAIQPSLRLAGFQPRPAARTRRSALVVSSSQPGGPVELPGGHGWWLCQPGAQSCGAFDALIYGAEGSFMSSTGFTITRPNLRTGPNLPGLVRRSPAWPQRYAVPAASTAEGAFSAALVPMPRRPLPGELALASSAYIVIDTEYELMDDEATAPEDPTCLSIVPWGSVAGTDNAAEELSPLANNSRHPRRTQLIRFTCNLCGTSNTQYVNPHAWERGSVFCRCSGCTSVHKLKDNLEIFSETQPVFPPPELRATLMSPEVLEILERMQRHMRLDN